MWRSAEECGGVQRSVEECRGVWRSAEECEDLKSGEEWSRAKGGCRTPQAAHTASVTSLPPHTLPHTPHPTPHRQFITLLILSTLT